MTVRLWVSFTLLILNGCSISLKDNQQNEIISEVVDQSKKTGKMALICLSNSNRIDRNTRNHLNNKFLLYEVNGRDQHVIQKIIHTEYLPLCVVLDGESIISIFPMPECSDTLSVLVEKMLDFNSSKIELNSLTQLEGDNAQIMRTFNHTLQLKYRIEKNFEYKGPPKQMINYENISSNFYYLYLYSKLHLSTDSIRRNNLYDSLWMSATKLERKLYTNELLEIYDTISKRSRQKKSNLKFINNSCDLSNINKADTIMCQYNFTNTGKTAIVILSANSTCDCTVANWPKQPILPGDSSIIEVKFIPKGIGMFHKIVDIRTSEPAYITLDLNATVIEN